MQMAKIAAYSTFGDYVAEPTVELAERHAQLAPRYRGSKVSSPPVARTPSTWRPSWRAATGTRSANRPSGSSSVGRRPTTACTTRARHWPASPATAGTAINHRHRRRTGRRRRPARHLRAGRAGQRRRLLLRAGDRCRWRYHPAPDAARRRPQGVRRVRRAVRRRRGGDRLRPDRRLWFANAVQPAGPRPTTAKGLTSSSSPMGAVLIAPRLAEPFFKPDAGVWWRASTPATPPRRAVAGHRDHRARRSPRRSPAGALAGRELASRWPTTNVLLRCAAGPARWRPSSSASRRRRSHSRRTCRSYGVATRAVGLAGIQVSPAFVMTEDQVRQARHRDPHRARHPVVTSTPNSLPSGPA